MEKMQRRVFEWRERVGLGNATIPEDVASELSASELAAWNCFMEEVRELNARGDLGVAIRADAEAKEMADVLVTLLGYACARGVDLEPVFEAVMASNDLKTGEKNSAGKVVKGPNYVAPDIASVLRAQGWEG
jgi:hypothetical protein